MTTIAFTISSPVDIPVQIATWLAVCETGALPGCSYRRCVPTDIQVLPCNKVRILCIVEDHDLPLVLGIRGWASIYLEKEERQACGTVPVPAWVFTDHATKGPTASNLTSAKYLAEIVMALYRVFKSVDTDYEGAQRTCLLYLDKKIVNGLGGCALAEPLSDDQLESILNLADQRRIHLTLARDQPVAQGTRAYYELQRVERERYGLCQDAFPELGPSPHGSPVAVAGRTRYSEGMAVVASSPLLGQEPHCTPFVPKINELDLQKLFKVAYLPPGYGAHMWFTGKSPRDIRRHILA